MRIYIPSRSCIYADRCRKRTYFFLITIYVSLRGTLAHTRASAGRCDPTRSGSHRRTNSTQSVLSTNELLGNVTGTTLNVLVCLLRAKSFASGSGTTSSYAPTSRHALPRLDPHPAQSRARHPSLVLDNMEINLRPPVYMACVTNRRGKSNRSSKGRMHWGFSHSTRSPSRRRRKKMLFLGAS